MPTLFTQCTVRLITAGLVFLPLLSGDVSGQVATPGLVPTSPQPRTDKQGNTWYVEQNGMLSRQGGGTSILSGSMMLMVGSEQFYCNQPLATADGREMVLMGQQPMQGGLQVTRYVRFLEKEGGLRYLEVLTNTSPREITTSVEIRHNFSGQVKSMVTDAARAHGGNFEKQEAGIAVVPGSTNYQAFLFTVCGPRSSLKPRIASQNQYQLSFFHSVTIPAGKAVALAHTVTQGKLSLRPDAAELEKAFRPFALARHTRDLPKGTAPLLVNLRTATSGVLDLGSWFPEEISGIKRESLDILAMGEGTRLRGRATCARLTLHHRLGQATVPWEQVIAITGGRHEGGESRLYLADGQILRGRLEAEELKFVLSSGLQMSLHVAEMDRLVMSAPAALPEWPPGVTALAESWNGERWAMRENADATLTVATAWGSRELRLAEISGLTAMAGEEGPPLVELRDGSRLRVWLGGQGDLSFTSAQFGKHLLPGVQLRALAVATSLGTSSGAGAGDAATEGAGLAFEENADGEPLTSFADLAGDQRLVAVPADPVWQVVTSGGLVALDPGSIREMRNVSEEVPLTGADDGAWFQMELWGGGTVMGQLRESTLGFRMGSTTWRVPVPEVLRVVNPVPKIADNTLARIGQLLRELGHDEWQVREKATGELAALGEMARSSLQEALKQSEDLEVRRRIEAILGDIE